MRYPLIFFLLLSLLTSHLTGQTQPNQSKSARPGSRVVKETTKAPPAKLSLGATIEKYVSSYEINADGTARETLEMRKRCATNECIEYFSNFKHVFNSDLQKLKVIDAYLVKADGKVIKMDPTAITDRPTPQTEAAPGFSSLRELEIKFSPWRIGDAAYFKLESLTTKPTLDGRYDTLELFSVLFDWKSIEINVTAPAGYELFTEAVGLDGGKLPDENGRSRWQYKKDAVARIDFEPLMTPLGVSPRFALTTFRDPAELGTAFWDIVKKKAVVTPEVQALADEITKGISTPSQQASAIYDWVNKNIRYFFIVLDRGGWVPHDSAQILKNGYGDCKDYTVIIHALLKAKGIDSTPVLIRSDLGNWFPAVPTMEYFNHAVLYIPSLKLFADATMPNTRLGLVPQTIVGKKAVLAGEKTGIIEVPKDNPSDNQILSDVTYSFTDSGDVKAQTRNTYVGRSEIVFRPIFGEPILGRDPSTLVKLMLAFFGVAGDGKVTKVANPHEVGEPFSVEIEAGVENYTTFISKGRLSLPIGLNMVNLGAMEQFAITDSRKTSLDVGATKIRENISIVLPPAVKIVEPPRSVNVETSVGTFTMVPEIKDGRLHITRELVIAKDSIEPADYPQFRDLVLKLLDSHKVEIDYTADPSLLQPKSKELKAAGKTAPKSLEERILEAMGGGLVLAPALKSREVRELEAKIAANEDDDDSRRKLLRHYANFETKQTAAVQSAQLKHRLWLVKNRPHVSDHEIFGWWSPELPKESRDTLRDAWLAAVEKAKSDSVVRLSAIEFLQRYFPDQAEKLVAEGFVLNPTNYKYPLLMTEIVQRDLKKDTPAEQKKVIAKKVLEHGKTALALIKKERSFERDRDRGDLLKQLGSAAIAAEELDSASAFATELILDFGKSIDDYDYDDATHLGNITLGRVELRKGNTEKAKEYLLVAIRSPLRKPKNSLFMIDTRLARELYEKGVKAEVLEFLKLCLELDHFKTEAKRYANNIKALKLWQEQIDKGLTPSFDFDAP